MGNSGGKGTGSIYYTWEGPNYTWNTIKKAIFLGYFIKGNCKKKEYWYLFQYGILENGIYFFEWNVKRI